MSKHVNDNLSPVSSANQKAFPVLLVQIWNRLRFIGRGLHILLLGTAVLGVVLATITVLPASWQTKPAKLPSTMEEVDWHDPQSSVYCLACHRQVAPAMAGRDVEQGHPQNVPLSEARLKAIADLGTVVGPGNTLICMSCHKLGQDAKRSFMLADTTADGRLCEHCHPGHYAKGTPHDLRLKNSQEKNRLGQTVTDGGPCSACHLSHRYARDFVSTPLDPDGRCITCHQQYRIAAGHARTSMEHPQSRCLECHNPHDTQHDDFLQDSPSELCLRCHQKMGDGIAGGMHPLGPMDYSVPQALIDAGATAGKNTQELTCLVCHKTHEAGHDSLLVTQRDTNQLCLSCHQDKQSAHAEGALPRHGQSPKLNAEQQAVVASWNNRTGPNQELLCVSCHKVHNAETKTALLSFQPKYGETCVLCHPNQATVFGSTHDLQINFPNDKNKAGMTTATAGTCSACHLAHQYPREAAPTADDPSGQCMSCHRPGQIGQSKLAGHAEHPKTKCADCHDPHERRPDRSFMKPQNEMCGKCHAEQTHLIGGPHDITASANLQKWPEAARTGTGLCSSCHQPHGDNQPDPLRLIKTAPGVDQDLACLICHPATAWGASSNTAAIHPRKIVPAVGTIAPDIALTPNGIAGGQRVGCRTCHNPHGGKSPAHLARVKPEESTASLCLKCHEEKKYIEVTGHSAEKLAKTGFDTDSCKPCHAMHAEPNGAWGQMLSPRFLEERCRQLEGKFACAPCLACHHEGGPAPVRRATTHPEMIMMNIVQPTDAGYLPLFNIAGHEDPHGQVACRTCHVSHGRLDLLKRRAENPEMTAEEQHSLRMQVRPFITPNACSACHGPEARARFLFFHDPTRQRQQVTPSSGL